MVGGQDQTTTASGGTCGTGLIRAQGGVVCQGQYVAFGPAPSSACSPVFCSQGPRAAGRGRPQGPPLRQPNSPLTPSLPKRRIKASLWLQPPMSHTPAPAYLGSLFIRKVKRHEIGGAFRTFLGQPSRTRGTPTASRQSAVLSHPISSGGKTGGQRPQIQQPTRSPAPIC